MAKKVKNTKGAELRIYGEIWSYGEGSSKNISTQLRELAKNHDEITIRVNSGGGSVAEAVAIYNIIKSTDAFVTIIVEGIAASAMSFILMAADKVIMGKATRLMLHKMSGGVWGSAKRMRDTADMMESWENDIYTLYADKTGMTEKEIQDKFFEEGKDTWLSAKEALDYGLVDEINDGVVKEEPSNIQNSVDSFYQYYQNEINNTLRQSNKKIEKMNKEHLEMIGLPENATDEQITAKLAELKTPKVENKANQELLDKLKKMEENQINNLVDNAIAAGKITASEREDWLKMADASFDNAKNALDKMPGRQSLPDFKGDQAPENRANWTIVDYLQKAPEALETMKENEPDKYKALYQAEYGN